MDKAAIVIVHYKGEDDTWQCLQSILANKGRNKKPQIILVVNPETDEESLKKGDSFTARLQKTYPQIVIIKNKRNTGFGFGNNVGIKKAIGLGCDYIVLLNNDTLVSPQLLDKLISFANSDTAIGIVSPKIYFAKGFEYHKSRYKQSERGKVIWYAGGILDWDNIYARHRGVDEVDDGQYDKTIETDFATGCCLLLKKVALEKIGIFDDKYFLYYEDVDLSVRAKKCGLKVMYYPEAILWHKNAASSGRPGSEIHIYYQNRNRLYFGFKYASVRTRKSLFFDSLRLVFKGGVYAKAVFDYYRGKMGEAKL